MVFKSHQLLDFDATRTQTFRADHPMFKLKFAKASEDFLERIQSHKSIVVVGLGGSVLPLKALVDFFGLQEKIIFLDSPESELIERRTKNLEQPLFCIASKSGETLEVKSILSQLLQNRSLDDFVAVTDAHSGSLRTWATENKIPSCEIPSDIGGRFTNFSAFHFAVLERFGIDVQSLVDHAKKKVEALQKEPQILEHLYQSLFESGARNLILWCYGDRLLGLGQWIQQAIAESLGKINSGKKRVGLLPVVLSGPQDQHSSLQFLKDGPQENVMWFFHRTDSQASRVVTKNIPTFCKNLSGVSDRKVMDILYSSTFQSFVERVTDPESSQDLFSWGLDCDSAEDISEIIVLVQAFIEYAGERLNVNAFDQPGVERGKEIARELLSQV